MSTDVFELHIQQSLEKLENLWQRSNSNLSLEQKDGQSSTELPPQQQVLRESLEELTASIEELQLATETLREQNDELIVTRQKIEAERQYYRELFDLSPDCYLITSKDGTIKEANQKAVQLLQVSSKYLSRKSLAVFIALDCRQEYYTKLNQLKKGEISEATWQLEILTRQQQKLVVECVVMAKRDLAGEIVNLRWHISPIKADANSQDTTNLMPILINSLRYPLYNLATEIEEIKATNKSATAIAPRTLQKISQDIFNFKHIVNNAYLLDCLQDKQNLQPSLIDYQSFIAPIIKQTRQRTNLQSEIVLEASESCAGISNVLCLEQIIINLLDLGIQQNRSHPIWVKLSKQSSESLEINFKFPINPNTKKTASNIFAALVRGKSDKIIEDKLNDVNSLQDLSLAVVKKCVWLLKGKIELLKNSNNVEIAVKLPLILTK